MENVRNDGGEERRDGDRRAVVAILPGSVRLRYRQLLGALEEAYPLVFAGSSAAELHSADAVIAFPGERRPDGLRVPCLELRDPGPPDRAASPLVVELSRSARLERPLRGQRLLDEHAAPPRPIATTNGARVLAAAAGMPIWVHSDAGGVDHEIASALPDELGEHEYLRDHLGAGRFWSLLPLVHFLKNVSCGSAQRQSGLRACFVLDDPNVRFSSYGYVNFPDLARDARECGYHVAFATIPLDLVLPGRGAVSLFRDFKPELSLAVHGNDHVRRELERCRSAVQAERTITSALARVRRFEQRAGTPIDRVMCPPHGACGPAILAALFKAGFLGLAASRPFPWDDFADQRRWRLGGWLPAQLSGGGLPVIPRYSLSRNLDDLVFRALLGQPLILYGHHTDLRDGLEPFRAAAARVGELGEASWLPLRSIAEANALVREQDGVASVTLYSRCVRLPRPAAPALRVAVPRVFGASGPVRLVIDGQVHEIQATGDGTASITVANSSQRDELRIELAGPGAAPAATIRDWRPRAWPLVRRAMTETRDRTLPFVRGG